ncbi:hypothetical protein C8R44DRAFT_854715 [Mycena epipterygia]|nr:hypothetical protein C8R44DRAFT_854715 [Mycena epipterygia]
MRIVTCAGSSSTLSIPQRTRFHGHSPSAPARRATAATTLPVGSICKRVRGARVTSGLVRGALSNAGRDGKREVLPQPSPHARELVYIDHDVSIASAGGTPRLHLPPRPTPRQDSPAPSSTPANDAFALSLGRSCAALRSQLADGANASRLARACCAYPRRQCHRQQRAPPLAYHTSPAALDALHHPRRTASPVPSSARPRLRYRSVHSVPYVPCSAVQRGTCGRREERSKEGKMVLDGKAVKQARNTKQREKDTKAQDPPLETMDPLLPLRALSANSNMWILGLIERRGEEGKEGESVKEWGEAEKKDKRVVPRGTGRRKEEDKGDKERGQVEGRRRRRTGGCNHVAGRENTRGKEIALRMARARAGDVGRG